MRPTRRRDRPRVALGAGCLCEPGTGCVVEPQDARRTWILTLRDRTHPINEQRASIEAIGGVQTLIEVDTCHCLMVSEPERLASILVERCRLYA